MNEYSIFHKIKTLATIWEPFEYKDFYFRQWDFTITNGPKGDAWIVNKIITANNLLDAINNFCKDLFNIIERCCFVSQCYFSMLPESWMVIKQNNNEENVFFLRFSREIEGVSLHFDKEEIESLIKLDNFSKDPVFIYLAESTRARSFYSRLAMLIITLESIAGEKQPNVTDKDYIKNEILKDNNVYNEIFKYGDGIRNKIFHGKEVKILDNYIDKIYKKIVEYFNTKYLTNISLEVIDPQRTFEENYEELKGYFKPRGKTVTIDFKEVIEKFNESANTNRRIPEGYEFLKSVKNY